MACPKTGSSFIEGYLMNLDPNGQKSRISHDDIEIRPEDFYHGVIRHSKVWDLKDALGVDAYNKLHVFGLLRHPFDTFDKVLSSCFFSKSKIIKTLN